MKKEHTQANEALHGSPVEEAQRLFNGAPAQGEQVADTLQATALLHRWGAAAIEGAFQHHRGYALQTSMHS